MIKKIKSFKRQSRETDEDRLPVCHLHPLDDGGLFDFFSRQMAHNIKEADDKEQIRQGTVYLAPANYHLLVESDKTFALSVDPKVNYSRPSIDVLFESAALAWTDTLMGIILTGASSDGAFGISTIKCNGGVTIAQYPADAAYSVMPQAAVNTGEIDHILSVDKISAVLEKMGSTT